MSSNTPLRYPGGKGKLTNFIKLIFEENNLLEGHYVEPYAGGAGIAINLLLLEYASYIHLNDINSAIYAFWHSVINHPEELCQRTIDTRINMKEWYRQKHIQINPTDHSLIDIGFSTFFLNRTNRSGILNGGVIGGKNQAGEWKLDARFNRKSLCDRIQKIAQFASRIYLYNLDAAILITQILPSLPKKTLVYLDPPYYVKGGKLYENHYNHDDHLRIAKVVQTKIKLPWMVSYDHIAPILKMYKGCTNFTYGINYSAADRYKGSEVMFFSEKLLIPDVKNPLKLKAA